VQTVWCLGHGTNSNSLVHTTTTCMLTWFQSRQSQIEAPMQLNGIKSLEYFQSETVQLGFWRINSISLHPFLITTYLHVLDQNGNRNKVTQVPRSHRNRLLYPTYQSKLTTHSIESEWWPTFLWSASLTLPSIPLNPYLQNTPDRGERAPLNLTQSQIPPHEWTRRQKTQKGS
jgi:hypothetical protein